MQTPQPDTTVLCRVCMTAKGEGRTIDLVNLYEASPSVPEQISLHEMLRAICAPVFAKEASETAPGMPRNACTGCRNDIIAAFRLYQQCIETDQLLEVMLAVKQEVLIDGEEVELKEEIGDPLMSCERQEMIKVEALDLVDEMDVGSGDSDAQEDDEDGQTCKICLKDFVNFDKLSAHVKNAHSLHLCRECGETFRTEHSLTYHKFKHKEPAICSECSKTFVTEFTLRRHLRGGFCPGKAGKTEPSLACKECNETFDTIGALSYHKTKHNGPAVCVDCDKSFATQNSLKVHIKTGNCNGKDEKPSDANEYECNICNAYFETAQALKYHKFKHEGPVACDGCDKTFATSYSMNAHTRNGRCPGQQELEPVDEGPFICSDCGKQMTNAKGLRVHQKYGYCVETEKSTLARTCKICNEVETTMYKLRIHMTEKHPDKMLICNICGEGFPNERGLEKHKSSHVPGRAAFACNVCDKEFPTRRTLRTHRVSHTGPLKCNVCDRVVFSKAALKNHMMRHTGERNFACEMCPMKFYTQVEKTQHLVTHTKERNFTCDTCGSRFTKKTSLKNHISQVHEGQRNFACTLCSYKCSKSSQLKRHMYSHTGEKPYKCTYCDQAYAQSNDLVKHVARVHQDGKPYPCDRCDESFRLMTDLRQHYRVHVRAGEESPQQGNLRFTCMSVLSRRLDKDRQQQLEEGEDSK